MPRYIVVFGRRRMYADHSPRNTAAAMMQVHIRLVFLFGRQMDRSFDILRHRNGRYTITMLTDEELPAGLILRPLGDGGLWNFDIGFNLVSDDYGRRDIWLGGVDENFIRPRARRRLDIAPGSGLHDVVNPQISHGYGQYANVSRIMPFVDCRESCPSITYDKSILNEIGIQLFDFGKYTHWDKQWWAL